MESAGTSYAPPPPTEPPPAPPPHSASQQRSAPTVQESSTTVNGQQLPRRRGRVSAPIGNPSTNTALSSASPPPRILSDRPPGSRRSRQRGNRQLGQAEGTEVPRARTDAERIYNDRYQLKKVLAHRAEPDLIDLSTLVALGAGMSGRVYSGMCPTIGRSVAIKLQTRSSNETDRAFSMEVALSALTSHAFVTHLTFAGMGWGHSYMLVRLAGRPLAQVFEDNLIYTTERSYRILFYQLLQGINHLHRVVGISHGDLHSRNLLVEGMTSDEAIARITDLGSAKAIPVDSNSANLVDMRCNSAAALDDVRAIANACFIGICRANPSAPMDSASNDWPFAAVNRTIYTRLLPSTRRFLARLLSQPRASRLSAAAGLADHSFFNFEDTMAICGRIEARATAALAAYRADDDKFDRIVINDVGGQLVRTFPALATNPRLRVMTPRVYPEIYRGGVNTVPEPTDPLYTERLLAFVEDAERTALENRAIDRELMRRRDNDFVQMLGRFEAALNVNLPAAGAATPTPPVVPAAFTQDLAGFRGHMHGIVQRREEPPETTVPPANEPSTSTVRPVQHVHVRHRPAANSRPIISDAESVLGKQLKRANDKNDAYERELKMLRLDGDAKRVNYHRAMNNLVDDNNRLRRAINAKQTQLNTVEAQLATANQNLATAIAERDEARELLAGNDATEANARRFLRMLHASGRGIQQLVVKELRYWAVKAGYMTRHPAKQQLTDGVNHALLNQWQEGL